MHQRLSPHPTWWHVGFLLGFPVQEGGRDSLGGRAGICRGHFTSGGHPRVGHVWPEPWALVLWFSGTGCWLRLLGASFPWQVLEERQRLWLSELKRLYLERLHEVAQKAERSERNLQLQLFMAQQEQRRLRKELRAQQGLATEHRPPEADPNTRPEEEARWEV